MTELSELTLTYLGAHPDSAAAVLERQPAPAVTEFLAGVPARLGGPVMAAMLRALAARCTAQLERDRASSLLAAMRPTAAAAILRRLQAAQADVIVAALPRATAAALQRLTAYPGSAVGAWMEVDVPCVPVDTVAGEAWACLREQTGELDRVIPVVDREQRARGQVRLAKLLRAGAQMPVRRLLEPAAATLGARERLEGVRESPGWRSDDPLPVITRDGVLAGTISFAALRQGLASPGAGAGRGTAGAGAMDWVEACWLGLGQVLDGALRVANRPSGQEDGK